MDALTVEVDLERIEDLFAEPSTSPLSPRFGPASTSSGMDYAAEVVAAARRVRSLTLELRVAGGAAPTDDEVRDAVHRYARARAARQALVSSDHRRFARVTMMLGVVLLFVLISASRLVADPTDTVTVGDILSEGLQIGAWVALWFPVENSLYGLWEDRRARRVWDLLATAEVRVHLVARHG